MILVLAFVLLWKLLVRLELGVKGDLLQLQTALIRARTIKTPRKLEWTRKYSVPVKSGQGWYGWPPRCITLLDLEPTSVLLQINMPDEKFRFICDLYEQDKGFIERKFVNRFQSNMLPKNLSRDLTVAESFVKLYVQPQHNYKFIVKGATISAICSLVFSTPFDDQNWIKDPSFQVFGTPFFRHWLGLSSTRTLKYWLPLYADGYAVECVSNGSCGLILGRWKSNREKSLCSSESTLFGALQPIWIPSKWRSDMDSLYMRMNVQKLSTLPLSSCFMVIYATSSDMACGKFMLNDICLEDTRTLRLSLPVKINRYDKFFYLAFVKNTSSEDGIQLTNVRMEANNELSSKASESIWKTCSLRSFGTESIFVISRWRRPRNTELTLAVPLSMHRMFTLRNLLRFYKSGPIVAVVAIQNEQEKKELLDFVSLVPNHMRMNVDFVVVLVSPWKDEFPINRLRNIALQYTTTDFVCVVDVDTFPISPAFVAFPRIIEREPELLPPNRKRCLVLANWIAAEWEQHTLPSIHELKAKYLKTWFPYCEASQSPISFRRWLYENKSFFVSFQPNFEPYCIMRTREFISFDERFRGYGFNKVSWAFEANLRGVEFLVDNRFYLLHVDHPTQKVEKSHQYMRNWIAYYAFVNEKLVETVE